MEKKIIKKQLDVAVLFFFLFTPLIVRMIYLDAYVYNYTKRVIFGAAYVFVNDSLIYTGIIFSIFVLLFIKNKAVAAAIKILILAVLLLLLIDFFTILNFSFRLVFDDLFKYGSYSFKYINQLYSWSVSWKKFVINITITLGYLLLVLYFFISDFSLRRRSLLPKVVLLFILFFVGSMFSYSDYSDRYVHSWIYKNIISYNLSLRSKTKKYSNEFLNNFSFDEDEDCLYENDKNAFSDNIIILMVESLSNYQSSFFSGNNDWTHNLDKIASDNIAYRKFYANGFTTEDGEVSILTGLVPIIQSTSYETVGVESFEGFFNIKDSLPNILKTYGYHSEFITSADLSFSDTGKWANSIGFDYIEGDQHPYYEKFDRFHFNAAPDKALYERVLDRMKKQQDKYFIFIKTVTSHTPFINPENKKGSEEETFRYVDRQLGIFYNRLVDRGFFEKGILIIVGDHHAMVPLTKKEIDYYGSLRAAATVPMIIATGDEARIENNHYQQIDIFNSLKGALVGEKCTSNWRGDFFKKKPANYIIHKRGDNRNLVSIFSDDEPYVFLMNGDDSRITTDAPVDKEKRELIERKINSIRILPKQ
ncbi:MAG: LTA synthase family protein [Candidatus Electrothrix sp. Rat3]|nr:LTA synthase family protein [Candidatus Electrothrix rattekaaiensis]